MHEALHTAYEYAVRMGHVGVNPVSKVEKPKRDTPERPVYDGDELARFLEAAYRDRLRALWRLVIVTGLRRAELAGLRWIDVSLDGAVSTLVVRHTLTVVKHRPVESDPKTRAGRRTLVLDGVTADLLR